MRVNKFAAYFCACALALNCAAPRALAGVGTLADAPDSSAGKQTSEFCAAGLDSAAVCLEAAPAYVAGDAAAAPKKKRNLFVRVITAPFRGLAKLFRGDDKRSAQTARAKANDLAKPAKPAPTSNSSAADRSAATTARTNSADSPAQSPPVAAANATTAPAPSASAPSASLAPPPSVIVRAPSAGAPDDPPAAGSTFTPLIVGVAGDSLTQGRALLEQGYLTEAIRELSIAAVTSSNLVEANNLLGLAHDRRGWHAQAREYYERALSVAPNDPRVLNNLGHSLYLDDRYSEALSRLKSAARLEPSNPAISNNLALVYGRLGKYGDAYKNFLRAGGELYAHMQTATLLEAAGRDREAIKHYESALRLNPASNEALRRLVTLYRRTGQPQKAEAAERALDPKGPAKTGNSGAGES